jgi:hypothetical protein
VQLILYLLLEVQHPALASLAELVNVGLIQLALTVLLARIKVRHLTSSRHVATALLVAMAPQLVCKFQLAQALVLLASTLSLELHHAPH